ncbi:MAG: Xaa-Pro peptidase family protein [Nitrospira sp.]|nr:Xaa-Pro peptidase family protein [Nitrospira sp.]
MQHYDAILIIASSETDSNLYYATRFLAPDSFIFLQMGHPPQAEKILVMSDLELDRAKAQARVNTVLSLSQYEGLVKQKGREPTWVNVLDLLLQERKVKWVLVPSNFPIEYADGLRGKGYLLEFRGEPFFEERTLKLEEEVGYIREVQQATEEATDMAIQAIREAEVRKGLLYRNGQVLTSEELKKIINVKLMEKGCVAQHTIVASGDQACDPHNEGSGPIRAGDAIIMDIFPRSSNTRYFADMTRTVVKGKPTDKLRRIYDTVHKAQEVAIKMIHDGSPGREIHERVCQVFKQAGFETGVVGGRMQGFFHGTGHGVGLDIHEPPRISRSDYVLKSGHVVTVEPGLYYPGAGAVRIEDMVWVTDGGCINLTKYPKQLEV